MVFIDKIRTTPENGTFTGYFENLEDVLTALKDIRNDTIMIAVRLKGLKQYQSQYSLKHSRRHSITQGKYHDPRKLKQ